MQKIELLAPAGDMEKLKTAVRYGADAVYFGGEVFSLRAGAGNLTVDEMKDAMEFLHTHGAKGYLTINIYPHNEDILPLQEYIQQIRDIPIDAFLVSDPGVMQLVKDGIPNAEIHLSTQANTTNYLSANFWVSQGVKRIVAAREMSLKEIREMREHLPEDIEIEAFLHGAMCISYSGRCLLSNYMVGRDANRGQCTHPCRWKYHLMEEKRPGEYFPIEEDDRGSYIMNSRDLCMLDCLPDMINAGVTSLKIEGRMKSAYYVATVVSAYRAALDSYMKDPENYEFKQEWYDELCKASHRDFTHGFFYQKPSNRDQNYLYHRNHHSPEGYFHPGSCQNIYKKRCHQRRCQCGNYGHSHRKRHITSCDIGDHIAGCSARTASHQDHSQCQICRKVHHFTQKPGDHRHNGILSHCTDHHFFGSGKNCPEVIQFYGQTHTKHDHSQKYRRIVRHPGKSVTPEKSQAGKSDDNNPDISGCKAADNSDFL